MVEARHNQTTSEQSLNERRARRADDTDEIRTEFDGVSGSRCVRIEHETSADGEKIEIAHELGHVCEPMN